MGTVQTGKLGDGLFGKTRSGVLSLLYGQPERSFYLKEIVNLLQTGIGAVQRELQSLQRLGIIEQERKGNQTHFQANSCSPIYSEIKQIVQKMDGGMDMIRQALSLLKSDIQMAFIYGSYAAHTQSATSDVDLFVMGDVDEMALHRIISKVEVKIAKAINYTLLNTREFAKKRREKGGFIGRILDGPKIMLLRSPYLTKPKSDV